MYSYFNMIVPNYRFSCQVIGSDKTVGLVQDGDSFLTPSWRGYIQNREIKWAFMEVATKMESWKYIFILRSCKQIWNNDML